MDEFAIIDRSVGGYPGGLIPLDPKRVVIVKNSAGEITGYVYDDVPADSVRGIIARAIAAPTTRDFDSLSVPNRTYVYTCADRVIEALGDRLQPHVPSGQPDTTKPRSLLTRVELPAGCLPGEAASILIAGGISGRYFQTLTDGDGMEYVAVEEGLAVRATRLLNRAFPSDGGVR